MTQTGLALLRAGVRRAAPSVSSELHSDTEPSPSALLTGLNFLLQAARRLSPWIKAPLPSPPPRSPIPHQMEIKSIQDE